jgi:monoamine oxidase
MGLAAGLPCGVLRLSDPVGAVEINHDGVLVTSRSGQMRACAAVIALPPALAVDAVQFTPPLPAETARIAAETSVWMGSIVKAVAVFDEPFWRDEQLSGSAVSYAGPFREFHDLSGPAGSTAALFAFANAGAFESPQRHRIEAGFREQLVRLFGGRAANPQAVFVMDWSREEYTMPPNPHPLASTAHFGHALYQQGSFGGRLQWASTETSAAYAGHIEGAIRAGLRAARNVTAMSAVGVG